MQNSTETYQTVLIVPQNEWNSLQERLHTLENNTNLNKNDTNTNCADDLDKLIPYKEASKFLGIDHRSLVRAKNEGRIRGVRGHSSGFSYRMGDLIEYKKNFGRVKKSA